MKLRYGKIYLKYKTKNYVKLIIFSRQKLVTGTTIWSPFK